MWTRDEILSRALAVFVGAILFFFEATVPALLLGDHSPLLVPLDVAVYGVAGVIFGFLWPSVGWRLGLYIFAIWPPVLLFSVFLAGEVPWNMRAELRGLLGYLLMLIAGCLGAELGAHIARRKNKKSIPDRTYTQRNSL